MIRQAFLAISVFCLLLLGAGIYIAVNISKGASDLDRVIQLHQVEILREHLLYRVKTVQSSIKAKNTRFFQGADNTINDVLAMDHTLDTCFGCHHSRKSVSLLNEIREHVLAYEAAISRMLTVRANAERLSREEDAAHEAGAWLMGKIETMISMTSANLRAMTREAIEKIARTNRILYGLLAAGPLMAIALGLMLAKSLAKPLGVLLQATRRLKAGDLGHRVEGLRQEFRELGESFNEMASSLEAQMTALQRAEQLMVCGTVAAGLAHEIKNPLAGIKISLEILNEDLDLTGDDRDILAKSLGEIDRVDTLLKSLLDFARPAPPRFADVDVNEVLRSAVRMAVPGRNASKIELRSALDPDLPMIMADAGQLQQVFLNLVLNALDAMPDGGTLEVASASNAHAIVVQVRDTGSGIEPGLEQRIFEPFFTRKPKGTGLGLAITHTLLAQQGGTIRVANRTQGGACFTVELPTKDAGREQTA